MTNKFGIPEEKLKQIHTRDKNCVYCHKKMLYPYDVNNRKDSATIEHLNFDGPFYWKNGLQIKDIVICCGQCNSSRGKKGLLNWFKTNYCKHKNINENTVDSVVKEYLKRTNK